MKEENNESTAPQLLEANVPPKSAPAIQSSNDGLKADEPAYHDDVNGSPKPPSIVSPKGDELDQDERTPLIMMNSTQVQPKTPLLQKAEDESPTPEVTYSSPAQAPPQPSDVVLLEANGDDLLKPMISSEEVTSLKKPSEEESFQNEAHLTEIPQITSTIITPEIEKDKEEEEDDEEEEVTSASTNSESQLQPALVGLQSPSPPSSLLEGSSSSFRRSSPPPSPPAAAAAAAAAGGGYEETNNNMLIPSVPATSSAAEDADPAQRSPDYYINGTFRQSGAGMDGIMKAAAAAAVVEASPESAPPPQLLSPADANDEEAPPPPMVQKEDEEAMLPPPEVHPANNNNNHNNVHNHDMDFLNKNHDDRMNLAESFASTPSSFQSSDHLEELKKPDYVNKKQTTNRNSLELRRLPVNILLQPSPDDVSLGGSFNDSYSDDLIRKEGEESASVSLLHKTCLNSNFSLRMQLMLSFGIVSSLTIVVVVVVCLAASILSGDHVAELTLTTFDELGNNIAGTTAHYLADELTPKIFPEDLVQILLEATQDRFAGYPIYEDDSRVPFRKLQQPQEDGATTTTTTTTTNHYPIRGKPLPLDWQMIDGGNVNESNYYEHVQDRYSLYAHSPTLDTSNPAYYMQGMCDPSVTDPNHSLYFPNCTDANNDIKTGGVVAPSPTNEQIHRKSSDLAPLLKSLYEYHQDVKNIGIYFSNSGAGGSVVFPHYELNSTTTYVSTGCNWMLDDHPIDKTRTTFATLEDFQRCDLDGLHQNGKEISSRLYNPMDRKWCRDQALDPTKIHHTGPFQSAWSPSWVFTIGKAVFDVSTKEFIACTAVAFVLDSVEDILHSSRVTPSSEVSVVRFNKEGDVVASTDWNKTSSGSVVISDLDVGVTKESYQSLYELVDYNLKWDPDETIKKYENHVMDGEGYLVATFPMPPVPDYYQADYEPEFLVIVSVSKEEFFRPSTALQESVDETVLHLEQIILIVGFVGLGMMVVIIFMVANALTFPLTYMNTVAGDIINNFGDTSAGDEDAKKAIEIDRKHLDSALIPKTELDDIVGEFLRMVRNFSGSAMAKSTREKFVEIDNRFSLVDEFQELYHSRTSDPKFKYNFPRRYVSVQEKLERKKAPPHRINFGQNVRKDSLTLSGQSTNSFMKRRSEQEGMRSPLFFWIVVLIVTPLLLTTITISCILMVNVSKSFPDYVDEAKAQFVDVEVFALETYVGLRANLTGATTERSIRDLHVLTRYTNWILNDALDLADGVTEFTSAVEECKVFEDFNDCPYVKKKVETCHCTWRYSQRSDCGNYTEESRFYLQPFHVVQSDDTEPDGDRFGTSYPEIGYSQSTVTWWDEVTEMPGAENISVISRHESTYDRIRSAGGLPVIQLLFNYDLYKGGTNLGVFVAFEDDGLFVGYKGCKTPGHAAYAGWSSTVGNGAYDVRPELCPLGKYGYDPRCRNWYHQAINAKGGDEPSVYAGPPYLFASEQTYAQSASSPISDAKTGRHLGQTLIDYKSQQIIDSLNDKNFALFGKGFPILITIETDNFGADTVIGPGMDGEAQPIADLVLPNDPECEGKACEEGFFEVLKEMKAGEKGVSKFSRVGEDGKEQTIYISYAPVVVNTFSSVDSADFSRGVYKSPYLLYSLAFAEYEDEMLSQFYKIEDDIDKQFYITLAVLCFTIVLATFFVVYFSKVITVSMTEPMLQLLDLVRTINRLKEGENRPEPPIDKQYGSREVLNVTCTMERLYKVIRSGNTAFFAGDVEMAFDVLKDALKLFKRLGNSKAIGVACNNLGNTLLAAYRTLKATKQKRICGFKKKEIIAKGTAFFHEAIQQGEKAYDEFYEREGWSPNCLDFMQHLSNRYFNRAMFLLTVKDDHSKPEEIKELGMRDLQISRDMDVEINDEGSQVGWNVRGVDKTFEVMLSRFRGHLALLEMGYPDDFELEEWLEEAYQMVRKELKARDPSPLFFELGPAGRMQQIELELMKYYEIVKDITTAARIGIRMLVEDEFTLPAAQLQAVRVVQLYSDRNNLGISRSVKSALVEYRHRIESAVEEISTLRANQTESGGEDESDFMAMSMDMLNSNDMSLKSNNVVEMTDQRRVSLTQSSRGDTTMEMF